MGEVTKIAWTDHTFNPWMGCSHVSPGCDHCYAEALGKRTGRVEWGDEAARVVTSPGYWRNPEKWNRAALEAGRPALVFCASLADVFEDRPELVEPRARLFEIIEATRALEWQLLTKRPENVRRLVPSSWLETDDVLAWQHSEPIRRVPRWPENVWIGTTVEDQQRADDRIPALLEIPAPVRFLSCEPLLGPLDLSPWLNLEWMDALRPPGDPVSFRGEGGWGLEMFSALAGRRSGIRWIIVGGESGPRYRPLDLGHARDVLDQGRAAEVPVFFKQVGGPTPAAGGDEIDGRRWKEFPERARR